MPEAILAGEDGKSPAIDQLTGRPLTMEELLRRRGLVSANGSFGAGMMPQQQQRQASSSPSQVPVGGSQATRAPMPSGVGAPSSGGVQQVPDAAMEADNLDMLANDPEVQGAVASLPPEEQQEYQFNLMNAAALGGAFGLGLWLMTKLSRRGQAVPQAAMNAMQAPAPAQANPAQVSGARSFGPMPSPEGMMGQSIPQPAKTPTNIGPQPSPDGMMGQRVSGPVAGPKRAKTPTKTKPQPSPNKMVGQGVSGPVDEELAERLRIIGKMVRGELPINIPEQGPSAITVDQPPHPLLVDLQKRIAMRQAEHMSSRPRTDPLDDMQRRLLHNRLAVAGGYGPGGMKIPRYDARGKLINSKVDDATKKDSAARLKAARRLARRAGK